MRTTGKLKKWNQEKGYGFLAPAHGGPDVFVHVSELPRGMGEPKPGQSFTFDIESQRDGKLRAVRLQQQGASGAATNTPATPVTRPTRQRASPVIVLTCVAVFLGIAWAVYDRFKPPAANAAHPVASPPVLAAPAPITEAPAPIAEAPAPTVPPWPASPVEAEEAPYAPARATYRCDGRQHCSQMHSCEEATYFLQHCPDVVMDGDGDGIPCESQWCGRPGGE